GVQAPVDEHAEAVVAKPRGVAGRLSGDVAAHGKPPVHIFLSLGAPCAQRFAFSGKLYHTLPGNATRSRGAERGNSRCNSALTSWAFYIIILKRSKRRLARIDALL